MASEWSSALLLNVCREIYRYPSFYGMEKHEHGVPVIRGEHLLDNGAISTDWSDYWFVSEEYARRFPKTRLELHDIVMSVRGSIGTFSRVGLVHVNAQISPNLIRISPDPDRIEPAFLYYALRGSTAGQFIISTSSSSAVPAIRAADIKLAEIPLPGREEQRAIAHILGTLDEKIELNRRMNETLESMARAIFKSWFVDFDPVHAKSEGRDPGLPKALADLSPDPFGDSQLGKVPRGWEVGVLDELIDVVLGGDWGSDNQDTENSEAARCIRGADIPNLQIGGTGKMPIRYLKPSSLAKRRLNDGDLVVEISGGSPTQSTGRPVLVSRELLDRLQLPLVCSNFCRLLKLKSPIYSKLVYLWLRILYANDELLQFENGTTGIKNFAFSLFSSTFKLCIPPANVLEKFDRCVSPLFKRQQASAAEADTLAALRDTLLPRLISGELRIKGIEQIAEAV